MFDIELNESLPVVVRFMAHSEALFDAISISEGLAGSAGMDWDAGGAGF